VVGLQHGGSSATREWARHASKYLRLQPYASQAATVCISGCNRVSRRLQPCVSQAATVRSAGLQHAEQRDKGVGEACVEVSQAATVCIAGCNRVYRRLQPCVSQAATVRSAGLQHAEQRDKGVGEACVEVLLVQLRAHVLVLGALEASLLLAVS
jgi:hypothetical protein